MSSRNRLKYLETQPFDPSSVETCKITSSVCEYDDGRWIWNEKREWQFLSFRFYTSYSCLYEWTFRCDDTRRLKSRQRGGRRLILFCFFLLLSHLDFSWKIIYGYFYFVSFFSHIYFITLLLIFLDHKRKLETFELIIWDSRSTNDLTAHDDITSSWKSIHNRECWLWTRSDYKCLAIDVHIR